MESYLKDNFEILFENSSEKSLRKWRSSVSIVKNPRRRFSMTADLDKRSEIEQEELRRPLHVRYSSTVPKEYEAPEDVRKDGFYIGPNELKDIVGIHGMEALRACHGLEGIARALSVSLENGVSTSEIPLRQKIYGSNQYIDQFSRSFWTFVWEVLHDLTLIILMICAIVSIGLGIATEGWAVGMYDGFGIIVFIVLVVYINAIIDYQQYLKFKDLDKEKNKTFVQVTRDGYRQNVSINDLVVGDIVDLFTGDHVPADGILIHSHNLLIDESSLSGEQDPIELSYFKPFLLSGTKVQTGSVRMLVTSVGMRTEWGRRLMPIVSEWGEDETPMQVKLNDVATIIAKIVLAFAVLTFVALSARFRVEKVLHNEFLKWSLSDALRLLNYFSMVVTIIMIAVPEGLPLGVTLSLAYAMKKLMNDQALVRRLSACVAMSSASCICTDKTGTLTTNHMVVDTIWICEETKVIRGTDSGDILKSTLSGWVLSMLLESIFQNTGSMVVKGKYGKNNILGTPTESALLKFGLLLGGDFDTQRSAAKVLMVEHFNSDRKKMSMLVALPRGIFRAFCTGAPELIIQMCNKMIGSTGSVVNLSEEQVKNVMDVINAFACESLRVLCLAFKDMEMTSYFTIPADGYTLIAVVGIKNPVRPGIKKAVQTCLAAGINMKMVTGDNINTAKAIARECGILTDDGLAIEGYDFRSKSPQEMNELIPKIQVLARSLPSDKHTMVTQLRKFGEVVAMTGDGANDTLALHESDIGLAMGIAGTKVAKENADVIIMDDNFATIVNVAKWGRAVYVNIQKFVQFQLTVTVVALMINFLSACLSGSTPLTTVHLLWVNMIMDTLGTLALATEPPNDELMKRPPVGRGVNLITRTMWRNIIGQSIYQLVVLGVFEFYGKQLLKLNGPDASSVLNSFIFNTFVFSQVFNEINSREMEKINVFRGMFDSWLFVIVIVSTVAFQVIMVEFLGAFASTVPLSWQLWLLSILIGSISMIIAVILKCIPVEPTKHSVTEKRHEGYEELPSANMKDKAI